MAKALDPREETVRTNLVRFREAAKLSQAEASELSGVSIDNLRRYENGSVTTIPFQVISALAKIYGHAMEDFDLEEPPPPKLDERPTFHLRTTPGMDVDPKFYQELKEHIEQINKLASKKRRKS